MNRNELTDIITSAVLDTVRFDAAPDPARYTFVLIVTEKELELFKSGELVFDKRSRRLISPSVLSQEECEKFAREKYNYKKLDHWKEWPDLTAEQKEEFIDDARRLLERNTMAYPDFMKMKTVWNATRDLEEARELENGETIHVFVHLAKPDYTEHCFN